MSKKETCCLGEVNGNMDVLRSMREQLIDVSSNKDMAHYKERWNSFGDAIGKMQEAIESEDLADLVAGVRKMKNLLRRQSVRKDLARMESDEKDLKNGDKAGAVADSAKGNAEKKPKGKCSCARCGATIDGSEECIKGALCVECAMQKRPFAPGEKEDKKDEKKAKKGTAFPPEMIGMGGMGGGGAAGGVSGDDTGQGGQAAGDEQGAESEPEEPPVQEPKKKDKERKLKEKPLKLRKRKDKKKKKKQARKETDSEFGAEKRTRIESRLRRRKYKGFGTDEDLGI